MSFHHTPRHLHHVHQTAPPIPGASLPDQPRTFTEGETLGECHPRGTGSDNHPATHTHTQRSRPITTALNNPRHSIDPLAVRNAFGKRVLQAPEPCAGGWKLFSSYAGGPLITIIGCCTADGGIYTRVSISRPDRRPDTDDVTVLTTTVFGGSHGVSIDWDSPADPGEYAHVVHILGPTEFPHTA